MPLICTISGSVLISSVQAPFRLSKYYPENLLDKKVVNLVEIDMVKFVVARELLCVGRGESE